MAALTSAQFLRHLRDALNHLYDLDRLRRNPLLAAFKLADRFDAPASLQRILTEAIEALKPDTSLPPSGPAWRTYDLLLCCYVQQLDQATVAGQLGISPRQLRRDRNAALELLAQRLWQEYDVGKRDEGKDEADAWQETEDGPDIGGELAWLRDASLEKPTDLNETLRGALDLARRLAGRYQAQLEVHVPETLPGLAVHPVALSQILLNLLGVAVHQAASGQVRISAQAMRWEAEVTVHCAGARAAGEPAPEDVASLRMARHLATLSNCRLDLAVAGQPFSVVLTLPALEQMPVLVIDDNTDTLQLLQRYTSFTRYRLVATQDPEQALSLAERIGPHIIVLDVMMPQIDGWRVLERLREHPATEHVPVLVCSILSQEELALSLGAAGFLRKPVTRHAFLAALDAQVALREKGPR